MQKHPFFSIIVATYNQANLLKVCIESIERQSYDNWEAIIVNNHSSDNTTEVVNSFKDSRLKEVLVHNDGVLSVSRNVGITESKGEWICMLDSDDIWYPDKLEELHDAIISNPIIDVFCHNLIMKNMVTGKEDLMTGRDFEDDVYKELILHRNFMGQTSISYKHSFLSEHSLFFNESRDVVTVEDYDFSLRLALNGAHFYKIDKVLGEWRVYGTNWSSSSIHTKNLESMLKFHIYNIQTFEPNKRKLWKDVKAGVIIKEANMAFKRHKYLRFIGLYIKAIALNPQRFYRYTKDRIVLSYKRIKYNK